MRKNMKIPRKKEKARTTNYYTENHKRLPAWFELTKKQSNRRMEVMIKNSVKKTYEWKHWKIQRFFQNEGEDYDNSLFQIYLLQYPWIGIYM
jgi:hypothetical protein